MGKLSWYYNRLRAMNVPEVCWRIQQKRLQRKEQTLAKAHPSAVCDHLFSKDLELRYGATFGSLIDKDSLPLKKEPFTSVFGVKCETSIHLLGGFDYDLYKEDWHAGFQTNNKWPLQPSYELNYKQRDDIGDARTNWELNRCFQFTLLAQAGDVKGLEHLFYSWNEANPWLFGISWTSVMEIAIRAIQWTATAFFLSFYEDNEKIVHLKKRLEVGALNMAEYVSKHYSRYSSANNHLLVEACSLVFVGKAFKHIEWQELGIKLLDNEIDKQNFPDGVNKEMSLHYQTFAMEAYALALLVSDIECPNRWRTMLEKQCEFVSWSISAGIPMEWGDDDEGKILDLRGGRQHWNHYQYVLDLYKYLGIYKPIDNKELYKHFPEGGYTFMRSVDHKVLLGIDHAPLGFGTIAAHGHADALSVQLIYGGNVLFADPGTYIYHCDIDSRNAFRKTIHHNTICLEGKDQSDMLGAFLWGKKANSYVERFESFADGSCMIVASHDGYVPIKHTRAINFDGKRVFDITDKLSQEIDYTCTYMLGAGIEAEQIDEATIRVYVDSTPVAIIDFSFSEGKLIIEDAELSLAYGKKVPSKSVKIFGIGGKIKTVIKLI